MIDVFGTLGPSCTDEETLYEVFSLGMTGIRINLSHVMLRDCEESIKVIKRAAKRAGVSPKILIDMQGPELRIGKLDIPVILEEEDEFILGAAGIDVDNRILEAMKTGNEVLLDDGKILAKVVEADSGSAKLKVIRGGQLSGRKSIAIVGATVDMPALTDSDLENIRIAADYNVTGVMQPFVRSADDLKTVREVLDKNGGQNIKIYAKIENTIGVENLESFFDYADEIVIARGDLGNAVPLWNLPKIQKDISARCNTHNMPFMVVTQMLASMEHSKVPTRAEVSDIYNAAIDGASSVMVTGETAVGDYPVEVIRYMVNTVKAACDE
ncbi:MAG: pyruvate kinase [Butyrivibrio sp.]|uniref:pyruvate kinase n=1 Tax=Butyrivibrio sp. TaxID=28121 RepID=UPI0025B8C436|nr:pyruvate kinase [Butyrivibrio sp.]MBQ6588865.1 pyruvate kinase [Butyrivibrio sp.]